MREQYTPKIIFSVFLECNSYSENYDHHYWTMKGLEMAGIRYVEAKGVYDGVQELSLVVKNTKENLQRVQNITKHFQQESYLMIDNEGYGVLNFLDGDSIPIGKYSVSQTKPDCDYTEMDGDYVTFGWKVC